MKISTNLFRLAPRSKLMAAAAMLSVVASVMGTSAGTAYAAKAKPPVAPSAVQDVVINPTEIYLLVYRAIGVVDYQLISGPNTAGSPVSTVPVNNNQNSNASIHIVGLVPNSGYVVQVRNRTSAGVSAWVPFSFRTPVDYPTPVAPQNLRVTQRTATTVTVMWDFDLTNPSYRYSLNGGPQIGTFTGCFPYCSTVDLTSATFALPAPGTSTRVTVIATSSLGKVSAPSELIVTN